MEDDLTREFFASICRTSVEKDIMEMLLKGLSNEEIIENLLQTSEEEEDD